MAERDAGDSLVVAAGPVGVGEYEGVDDALRVETAVDSGDREQALGHGGEGGEVFSAMVEEGALADVIAGGEDLFLFWEPDDKSKAAENVVEAGLAPAVPGGEEDGGVG